MKNLSYTILSLGLVATTSQAIEAPVDDAPPPNDVAQPTAILPKENAAPVPEAHQSAYLGVVAGSIPEMLAVHIGLHASEGVVVRALMPDGPAAGAGLAVHDVITRIGGQPVATSEDLSRKINQLKAGEKVSLDLIQKGKKVVMDVTLGARPPELAAPQIKPLEQLDQLNLDGVPQELAERVRRMIEGNLGDQPLDFGQGIHDAAPQFQEAMRDIKQRMEQAMQGIQMPEFQDQGGIQVQQGATFKLMDEQGSVELKSIHDGKEITVRDKDQQVVWSGPWDTAQDKAAAPEDIRQRVEKLDFDNNGNGLQMRFKGLNPEE